MAKGYDLFLAVFVVERRTRMYEVTKTFTSGLLKGLTITENSSVKFEVGKVYGNYRVVGVK